MTKPLTEFKLSFQKALVRCDFNVPLNEKGKIIDDFKIKKALLTINHLRKQGSKVVLISHLGRPAESPAPFRNATYNIAGTDNQAARPEKKAKKAKDSYFSLKPVALCLEKILKEKVLFLGKPLSRKTKRRVNRLKPGQVALLENLRFESGEEKNDPDFALALRKLGDVYVNEAFSVCHRDHASVSLLPRLLPSFAGFWLEKEVKVLSQLLENPRRPLIVIIGGAKLLSKIKLIEKFLNKADHILLGSKIIEALLIVKGFSVGRPWPRQEIVKKIENLQLTNTKLHLPLDVFVSPTSSGEIYLRETAPGAVRKDEEIFDIGRETIQAFASIIKQAKTILWSGPLGLYEQERFKQGTLAIAQAIALNNEAFSVIGGGDTVGAIKEFGLLNEFSHVSTGGGAMLAFLAGDRMPGLEALSS